MSPDRWVTLREVYRSTLDPERIERKIAEVEALVEPPGSPSTRSCAPASSRASASSSRSSTCPTSPRRSARRSRQGSKPEQAGSPADPPTSPCSPAAVARRLPPLDQVIDEGKVLALNMPAGVDRGWVTDLAETRHPPCTGGEAPHGKRQGVPLRSGTRSGTTPEMAGLDRKHAGVSGYGASRVGRSAHVGQESQGTPGPRSRPPMRLSRRGGPSVPSSRRCRPTAFDSGRREPPRTTRPGPVPRVGGPPGRPCTLPWRRRVSHSVAL